jgi:hypothetical protein
MRRHSMSDREAVAKILPRNQRDWRKIWIVSGYLAFSLAIVFAIFILNNRNQAERENSWQSATATIEDIRPVLASQVESNFGGTMLYKVEILVRYRTDDTEQTRWIRLEQIPETISAVKLQAFRWRGKQCIVRWKPAQPDRVIAEVN